MSWLRNLQGQLTDLANEVLSEATEEVADPESELQVANKKCSEFQSQLLAEQSKNSALEKKVKEYEEQIYGTHVEMDAIATKYGTMIKDRDDELRKLKVEIEQLKSKEWDDEDDSSQRCADLQKEIIHWKSLVKEQNSDRDLISKSECQKKLEELRLLKDTEIAALMEQQQHMLAEVREHYEEKLAIPSSSSTSNVDLLDAVLLEKEELLEEKKRLEELVKRKNSDEKPLIYTLTDGTESVDSSVVENLEKQLSDANTLIESLKEEVKEKDEFSRKMVAQEDEIKNMREQNDELMASYNEINEEFEKYRSDHDVPATISARNDELSQRIEFLKASLVEYEERYEMCKRENAETVNQLEKLSSDFERLRSLLAEAKQKNSENDASMTEEVDRLRSELEQSKSERGRLREDVDKFRSAIDSIDSELDDLRDSNNRLTEENTRLYELLRDVEQGKKEASNSQELVEYITSMKSLQDLQQSEASALTELVDKLKCEKTALERKNDLLENQMVLFKEFQSLSKQEGQNEAAYEALTKEKISILESLNNEMTKKVKACEDTDVMRQQEVASLNEQLKEALSAVSEMTEEYNKLKKQFDELEKEVGLRQSCVDELILQNNLLQVQYQESTDSAKTLKQELQAKESECCRLELEIIRMRTSAENEGEGSSKTNDLSTQQLEDSLRELSEKNDIICQMELENVEIQEKIKSYHDQIEELTKNVEDLKLRNNELEQCEEQVKDLEQRLDETRLEASRNSEPNPQQEQQILELQGLVEQLNSVNEQLKQTLTDKHNESVDFYTKLEQAIQRIKELETIINSSQEKFSAADQCLIKEKEQNEKLLKELHRLKEHLVFVEETSTREAIEAEKRETDLRDMVRALQSAHSEANVSASEATQSYESVLTDLKQRLILSEKQLDECKTKLTKEEALRKETQDALSSLQSVVRELSVDHEKESASSLHKNLELQSQVNEFSTKVVDLLGDLEKLQLDKQAVEEILDSVRSTLQSKQHIIEELEGQVEELRSPANKPMESYRIDDATLRQLFMNYFTATPDMRPDIAMLLASILEYPPEDILKIKIAVKPGNNAGKMGGAGTSSLAEQFIRFLENESESGRTAPHLPINP